jgi:ABC-type sugar transport system ATPase subunit
MTEVNEAPAGASRGGDGAEPLLRLRGIDKHFGPVQALYGVNLDLPAGQVTGLCGDNGAGKSVLTRTIAGAHQPDHGEIFFEGKPVHIRSTRDASALGIETVYQDLALADNLDIVQNMFLGRERLSYGLLDEDSMELQAAETLSTLRVTTVRSIRLVLLDEPTAALGVVQTRSVLDLIKRLRDRGLAVMVISHNLNDIFEVADRIAVLYLGRMVAEGPAADFDLQSVVQYMTTGSASGRPYESAGSASGKG